MRGFKLLFAILIIDFSFLYAQEQVLEYQESSIVGQTHDRYADDFIETDLKYEKKYKRGVYVQASLGGSMHYANFEGSYANNPKESYKSLELNTIVGVGLGYQIFFNAYNGLRIFSTTLYGDFKTPKYKDNKPFYIISTGVGLDYLVDFTKGKNPLGYFIGFGYEWNYGKFLSDLKNSPYILDASVFNTHGFFAKTGFSKTFSWRHRIELEYRIPFYSFLNFSGSGVDRNNSSFDIHSAKYSSYGIISFSYAYIFGGRNAN